MVAAEHDQRAHGGFTELDPLQQGEIAGIRRKADLYETLSGLPFEVQCGAQTFFDHHSETIVIGVEQLARMGIIDPLCVDFIVLHELGHFKELSEDPDGYRAILDEGKREDGLGRAYFGFYNLLMDIYVNTNTKNKAPIYGEFEFSREIKEMYRERLFPQRDLTTLPLSKQYGYYLLNLGMGVASDLTVSTEVASALHEPLAFGGKLFTTQEIINTFLRPALGIKRTGDWSADISQRKWLIDQTLRPVFERLIALDLAAGANPNVGWVVAELVEVEPTADDLSRAIDVIRGRNENARRSASEKAADKAGADVTDLARPHLSEYELHDFLETYRRVEPVMYELAALFRTLSRVSVEYKREDIGFFQEGEILDVDQTIREWATVVTAPERAPVMKRAVYLETRATTPREVRVWLNLDLSGSMVSDMRLLRDLSVAIAGALQVVTMGAKLHAPDLIGSLGIVGFNSSLTEILPLTAAPSFEQIAKAYQHLVAQGGTHEHLGLERILEESRRDAVSEERVEIVVGITDGDTKDVHLSKECLRELERRGVTLCAFHFSRERLILDSGEPESYSDEGGSNGRVPEVSRFKDVWGEKGFCVRRPEQVIPALRHQLRDLLRDR